jgi:hypothetical protein
MRIAAILLAGASLLASSAAIAQMPAQLQIGQMEVKVYAPFSKTKVAVQLTQDTALGRQLRGKVMERIAKRGNEVGFSGGNVMRMDVAYFDLLGGGSGDSAMSTPSLGSPGDNPRPSLLGDLSGLRNDRSAPPPRPPTLRMSLTLYSIDSGKVIWAATASCSTSGGQVARAGEAIINSIFDNADKSLIGDAGCPL